LLDGGSWVRQCLEGLKYGESKNLETVLLKIFSIHVGHDVACPEIIMQDDHPAGDVVKVEVAKGKR
jgi:hypothetical protein